MTHLKTYEANRDEGEFIVLFMEEPEDTENLNAIKKLFDLPEKTSCVRIYKAELEYYVEGER